VNGEENRGQPRERTALAWTRSALNMAAGGTLITRASFEAHLDVLAILIAILMAAMSFLIWQHGRTIYRARGRAGAFPHHQQGVLALLTAATLLVAGFALVITVIG
jgi:uncharacterized membrane protein YidH (DUF202 family)